MENLTSLKLRKITFIVLVCCLAAIFFSSFNLIIAKAHDVKRRADIKVLAKALDLYHDKYGYYPESDDDQRGWDLTYDSAAGEIRFLNVLKEEGFIDKAVADPMNNATFLYRYQKYPAGSFGCSQSFYILQIINFELPTGNTGRGLCPEMDWGEDAPNGYTVQAFD
ncbi:MAG: hypothetical protein PHZ04_05350 [Patescibacteria group bacterium]|nr:hypothetical protein [Patescibacteria group bacterium]MDD5554858.1 hypothetical protein [Patescibacteria group bacterium]